MEIGSSKSTRSLPGISRRSFVAWSGLLGAGVALTGCSPSQKSNKQEAEATVTENDLNTTRRCGQVVM